MPTETQTAILPALNPSYIDNNNGAIVIEPDYWQRVGDETCLYDQDDGTYVFSRARWDNSGTLTVYAPIDHVQFDLVDIGGADPSRFTMTGWRLKARIAVLDWELSDPPCIDFGARGSAIFALPLNHDNTDIQDYTWDLVELYPYPEDPLPAASMTWGGANPTDIDDSYVNLTRLTATVPDDSGETSVRYHEMWMEIDWHLEDAPPVVVDTFDPNLTADLGEIRQNFAPVST